MRIQSLMVVMRSIFRKIVRPRYRKIIIGGVIVVALRVYLEPSHPTPIKVLLGSAWAKCSAAQVNEFYPSWRWERYRLADGLKGKHVPDPPTDSILYDVLRGRLSKFDAVAKRVKASKNKKPKPNTLVIHLRLGDVIDMAVESVEEMLTHYTYYYRESSRGNCCDEPWKHPLKRPYEGGWNSYVNPLSYYRHVPASIKPDHVVLMGSVHKGEVPKLLYWLQGASKSCHYTFSIQQSLKEHFPNATVSLRLGMPPDDDLVFASQAAFFWSSGGGYGELIREFVPMYGGRVI